jgi:hypothetical protein
VTQQAEIGDFDEFSRELEAGPHQNVSFAKHFDREPSPRVDASGNFKGSDMVEL